MYKLSIFSNYESHAMLLWKLACSIASLTMSLSCPVNMEACFQFCFSNYEPLKPCEHGGLLVILTSGWVLYLTRWGFMRVAGSWDEYKITNILNSKDFSLIIEETCLAYSWGWNRWASRVDYFILLMHSSQVTNCTLIHESYTIAGPLIWFHY